MLCYKSIFSLQNIFEAYIEYCNVLKSNAQNVPIVTPINPNLITSVTDTITLRKASKIAPLRVCLKCPAASTSIWYGRRTQKEIDSGTSACRKEVYYTIHHLFPMYKLLQKEQLTLHHI